MLWITEDLEKPGWFTNPFLSLLVFSLLMHLALIREVISPSGLVN